MMVGRKKQPVVTDGPVPGIPSRERKKPHLAAWLFVLVLSGAGFAASVWYAGGVTPALDLVTTADYRSALSAVPYVGDLLGGSGEATTPPAPKQPAAMPSSAAEELFSAEMADQGTLSALAEGRVRRIVLTAAQVSSDTASVPFTVEYTSGPTNSAGKLYFVKAGSAWRMSHPDVGATRTVTASSAPQPSLVATVTQQQLAPQNQKSIAEGIIGKGFTTIDVVRVTRTPAGVSVDMRMSGGSWVVAFSRIALTRQVAAGKTYWFFSAIEQP